MPPGLRSGEKSDRGDESVMNFLKSAEFVQIITDIVEKKTLPLQEEISALRNEIKVIKESNIELIKLLTSQNANQNIFNKKEKENIVSSLKCDSKVTYADKASSNKNPSKNTIVKETENINNVFFSRDKNKDKNNNKDISKQATDITNPTNDKNKDRRKTNVIYGTADSSCTIKAVTRYKHFHVFRLDPELSTDALADYLRGMKISGSRVEKLQSKHPDEYSSFKLSVPANHAEDVLNPNLWPKDTCINRFFFRKTDKNTKT